MLRRGWAASWELKKKRNNSERGKHRLFFIVVYPDTNAKSQSLRKRRVVGELENPLTRAQAGVCERSRPARPRGTGVAMPSEYRHPIDAISGHPISSSLSLSPRLVCFCPLSFRDLPDSSAQVTRFRRKRLAELMNEMHVARSLSTRGRGRSLGSSPCAFLGTRATYGHSSYKFKRLRDYFFFALSYVTR